MKKILLASGLLLILSASVAFAWHGRTGGHHPEPNHYQAPVHHPEPAHYQGPMHHPEPYHYGYQNNGTSGSSAAPNSAAPQNEPGYYQHGGGHERAADNAEIHLREMQDPNHNQ